MMKRILTLAVAAGLFVCAGDMYAQCSKSCTKGSCATKKTEEKAKLSELKIVTKDEVAQLINSNAVTVIDARDTKSYEAGHIQGALSASIAKLPADKNTKLVFYCGGLQCPAAAKAAKQALANGYKNVMVFRGGWAEWQSQS